MKNVAMLLTGFLLALSACSMKQDPLHNQSDEVKNGIPAEKVKVPVGTKPDSFNIERETLYTFKEGKVQTIKINARANIEMPEYELRLVNKQQFEKITTKSVKGSNIAGKGVKAAELTITWTPEVEAGAESRETAFELQVFSKPPKGTTGSGIERTEVVKVLVLKDTDVAPTILKIEDFPSEIREGQMFIGKVFVEDIVGEDTEKGRPTLSILSETEGAPQLAQYMSMGPAKDLGNGQWVFDIRLDLRGEVTTSEFTTNVTFVARNRFLNLSPVRSQIFVVRTDLSEPQISWVNKEDVSFKVGQKNSYSFWIMDSKHEGHITWEVESSTDLSKWPGTASLACKYLGSPNGSSNSQAFCQLDWDIPADAAITLQTFNLKVINSSKLSGDSLKKEVVFKRLIKVTP